jgi:drug/metabolite transporter (DMT)-like permease
MACFKLNGGSEAVVVTERLNLEKSPRADREAGPLTATKRLALSILVLILGCGFGLQYAMARLMGVAHVEPLGALLNIHILLSVVFLSMLVATGGLFRPRAGHLLFFAVISAFSNVGQLGVELFAAHHVPAGELTLIVSLLPIFVLVFARMLRTEALTVKKVSAILLGVAASTAILLPQALEAPANLFWLAFTFLAPISLAIGMVLLAKYWPRDLRPLQVATGNLVAGTLMLLPAVPLLGGRPGFNVEWSPGNIAIAVFAVTVAIEFYVVAMLTRRGGAVMASCADFIAVAAGLGFGYLLFAEVPSTWMWAAAALCILALKLATDADA